MKFTSLLLLVVLISACSSGPKKAPGEQAADAAPTAATGVSILPAGPVTPNPYSQNVPSVSRVVQQQFNEAVAAIEQKDWTQAERLLLRLTREQPKLSGAHLNLGLVYRGLKDDVKAQEAFARAIASNSNNLDAYNQLAILKRHAGEFAAAEQLYQQALAVWPYHAGSHRNLGILYDLYMGKEQQALQHYRAYLELVGEDRQLDSWIADLERRLAAAGG